MVRQTQDMMGACEDMIIVLHKVYVSIFLTNIAQCCLYQPAGDRGATSSNFSFDRTSQCDPLCWIYLTLESKLAGCISY